MAKLKRLTTSLQPMAQRVRYLDTNNERERASRNAGRELYKTARWRRLRWSILERDLFTCQWPGCGRIEANTARLVADHIQPHRGDDRLFWDPKNLQCLCANCHSRHKQRAEASSALG
jgi:5-methylcytosine-specific restriction endonuclease McrA